MCVGSSTWLRSHNWQHGQSAMRIVKTRLREMLPDIEVFLDVDNLGTPLSHLAVVESGDHGT